MKLTSFDEEKVWIEKIDEKTVLFKQSSIDELINMTKAKENIGNQNVEIEGKNFNITIPEILDWDDNKKIITQSFFEGENLEFLLRDQKNYKKGVTIINTILSFLLNNDFYWSDFAPRNILISNDQICLVDFEKDLNFENSNLDLFFRDRVYEEYSSFLALNDRIYDFENVFELKNNEENYDIKVEEIRKNRIKILATILGYENKISYKEYLQLSKMFIIAEIPFYKNNELFFPRTELENLFGEEYVINVIEKNKTYRKNSTY